MFCFEGVKVEVERDEVEVEGDEEAKNETFKKPNVPKKVTKKVNNANRELIPKNNDRTGWEKVDNFDRQVSSLIILTDKKEKPKLKSGELGKNHRRTIAKCSECEFKHVSQQVRKHIEKHHLEATKFVCPLCGFLSSTREQFRIHNTKKHRSRNTIRTKKKDED